MFNFISILSNNCKTLCHGCRQISLFFVQAFCMFMLNIQLYKEFSVNFCWCIVNMYFIKFMSCKNNIWTMCFATMYLWMSMSNKWKKWNMGQNQVEENSAWGKPCYKLVNYITLISSLEEHKILAFITLVNMRMKL